MFKINTDWLTVTYVVMFNITISQRYRNNNIFIVILLLSAYCIGSNTKIVIAELI